MSDDLGTPVGGERRHFENKGRDATRRNARRPAPIRPDVERLEREQRRGLEPATDEELDYYADQTPGLDEAATPAEAREHLRRFHR